MKRNVLQIFSLLVSSGRFSGCLSWIDAGLRAFAANNQNLDRLRSLQKNMSNPTLEREIKLIASSVGKYKQKGRHSLGRLVVEKNSLVLALERFGPLPGRKAPMLCNWLIVRVLLHGLFNSLSISNDGDSLETWGASLLFGEFGRYCLDLSVLGWEKVQIGLYDVCIDNTQCFVLSNQILSCVSEIRDGTSGQ